MSTPRHVSRLRKALACACMLGACVAWSWPGGGASSSVAERLSGPLAPTLASVQWTRASRAVRDGDVGVGLAHARDALACAPRSGALREQYARLLALHLGSAEREPDAARRRAWLVAGIEVLDTAERELGTGTDTDAALRGSCALARAFVWLTKAEVDPELDWPGGADALRAAALEQLEIARAAGNPVAAQMLTPATEPR